MTFDSLLIHTCDIGTLTQGVADDYGHPAKTWPVTYPDEPCRMVDISGTEIKVGAEVVICDWKLFVDNSVVVDEQDRISDIKLRSSGLVLDASTYEIILMLIKSNGVEEHHRELMLQKVV